MKPSIKKIKKPVISKKLALRPINQWVRDALSFSGLSQVELARRLSCLGVIPEDRSIINKMTFDRDVSYEEVAAISQVTGFAVPSSGTGDSADFDILEAFQELSERDQLIVKSMITVLKNANFDNKQKF